MSHLLEFRKVNEKNVALYFEFNTVSTTYNLTSDKYLSLENWMFIYDELDEVIIRGSEYKERYSFDMDKGRLTVNVRWVKSSDYAEVLKILNLSVSEYPCILNIKIRLHSNFERLIGELEQKKLFLEQKVDTIRKEHNYISNLKLDETSVQTTPIEEPSTCIPQKKKKKSNETSLNKKSNNIIFPKKILLKKNAVNCRISQNSIPEISETTTTRNLKKESVDDLLATFVDHEKDLKKMYEKCIHQLNRNTANNLIQNLKVFDIVDAAQFQSMVDFAEEMLVEDRAIEKNYSDVIFNHIVPEWAMRMFRKKFNINQKEIMDNTNNQIFISN